MIDERMANSAIDRWVTQVANAALREIRAPQRVEMHGLDKAFIAIEEVAREALHVGLMLGADDEIAIVLQAHIDPDARDVSGAVEAFRRAVQA